MEFPAGGEVAGRVERFPAEWIWPDRQIALYEWLLPEGAAVEYPLHQDAVGEHRQSLFPKRDWLCSEAGATGDPADPGNHERSPVHRKHGNAGGRLAVAAESLEERVPS